EPARSGVTHLCVPGEFHVIAGGVTTCCVGRSSARLAIDRHPRKLERSEHAGTVAEGRSDDVAANRLGGLRPPEVAGDQLGDTPADERQQGRLLHDASADDDSLRRQRADDVHEAERQVLRLEQPHALVVERLRWVAPAGTNGIPGGESLEAVAVVRADPLEWVTRAIVRDPHVPELRMKEPVHDPPIPPPAAADSGPDGDVTEGLEAGRRSPTVLAKRSRVYICIERDRKRPRLYSRHTVT